MGGNNGVVPVFSWQFTVGSLHNTEGFLDNYPGFFLF